MYVAATDTFVHNGRNGAATGKPSRSNNANRPATRTRTHASVAP
ncbi:hypothetical protein PQQ51_27435 [Paraburkholderia xenovorans]